MDDDSEPCPWCGEPSGLVLGYDALMELFDCAACGQPIKAEYDESFDGEEEQQFFWIAKDTCERAADS